MNVLRNIVVLLSGVALPASAIDWPQYVGPNFNRSTPGSGHRDGGPIIN